MMDIKIEEVKSSSRKEYEHFSLPSDKVLHDIVSDIYGTLPALILGDNVAKVYITGSASLNRFGALKRKIKDIDVVIQLDMDPETFSHWKEKIKESLFALPESRDVDYAKIEDVEAQVRFESQGFPVETFIQLKGEETIDIKVEGSDRPLPFALIDSIFKKKYQFNPDKAQRDVWNVRDHLQSFEPKDHKPKAKKHKELLNGIDDLEF